MRVIKGGIKRNSSIIDIDIEYKTKTTLDSFKRLISSVCHLIFSIYNLKRVEKKSESKKILKFLMHCLLQLIFNFHQISNYSQRSKYFSYTIPRFASRTSPFSIIRDYRCKY